ncbi:MAG: hypothetical protein ACKN9T_11265 [Candidatus Methylumidiphilus sp.]
MNQKARPLSTANPPNQNAAEAELTRLAARYIWWKTPQQAPQTPRRIIAQVMNIGDGADIYPSFRFMYCELARLPAAQYLESGNIVARLNLPNMRHTKSQRLAVYHGAPALRPWHGTPKTGVQD